MEGFDFIKITLVFFLSKNKRICKNPYLPEIMNVLSKYPEILPEFMPIHVYREKLKEVARHFKVFYESIDEV